jgi:signal transduction histidine kinase
MTSLRRALLGIAAAGFAAGLVSIALAITSEHAAGDQTINLLLGPLVGWAFIGAGVVAWWRRPDNRFGSLMTAVGFTWFAGSFALSDAPGVFIVGAAISPLPFALLLHMLLAFPSGHIEGKWAKRLIILGYFSVAVVVPLAFFFVDTTDPDICVEGCPSNPLLVSDNETITGILFAVYAICALIALIGVAVILIRRLRSAAPAQRRLLGPLYVTGIATVILTSVVFLVQETAGEDGAVVVSVLSVATLASVPFAFLYGLLRGRLAQAGALGEIVASSGADLRDALASALHDPDLVLAYWLPDSKQYVDRDGKPVVLPETTEQCAITPIEHDGQRLAVIVHDSLMDEDRELIRTTGAAAALTLENERLNAELLARVEELSASRARIVEVGLNERRRLERDLHDGAQQRLVALRLQLRMAHDRTDTKPEAAKELLQGAMQELDEALAELRELARGIHPAVLTDRGLEAALKALATRSPLPVDVESAPNHSLPAPVESAAYFVVAEALTNVAKYAQASHARVAVQRQNGHAVVEVSDDGVGGADPTRGTGLSGLADRIAALDGRLEIESPEGGGTIVRANIPCG